MVSYVKNKTFMNMIFGQLAFHASHSVGWSLFPLFLLSSGFELIDLAWFYLILFTTIVITLLSAKKEGSRWILLRGLLIRVVMVLLAFKLLWAWQLWLLAVIYGLFWSLFWVNFNIRYYELTKVGGTAFASAIVISLGPLVGIVGPLLAGVIATHLGYGYALLASIPFIAISFMAFKKIPEKPTEYEISRALKSMRSVGSLLFIDGFWQTSLYVLIPLITIKYVVSATSYGAFVAYISIVGVIASFVLSSLADKFKNRSIFIYPTTILLAGFTMAAAFTSSLAAWVLIIGIVGFFRAMSSPLMQTVVVDMKKENLHDSLLAREFMISLGRVASLVVAIVLFYAFGTFKIALIVEGAVAMLYPLVLFKSGVYADVDKRMRYAVKNRFHVMMKVWFWSALMFFPKRIYKRWKSIANFMRHIKIDRIIK